MYMKEALIAVCAIVGAAAYVVGSDIISRQPVQPVPVMEPAYTEPFKPLAEVQEKVNPAPKKVNKIVGQLPANMASYPVKKKKDVFIKIMLPLIIQENAKILAERDMAINGTDIAHLYKKYKVKAPNKAELLKRIRPIPVSLALAQAAIESGWGTSRFARKGNALFGQHAGKGEKSIPTRRPSNVRVKAYDSLSGSIHDYMRNLNTHLAYSQFRSDRKNITKGLFLARALVHYSELKEKYVEALISVISFNNFTKYEDTQVAFNDVN